MQSLNIRISLPTLFLFKIEPEQKWIWLKNVLILERIKTVPKKPKQERGKCAGNCFQKLKEI